MYIDLMKDIWPILEKMLDMTDNEYELIVKIREESIQLFKSILLII